LAVGLGGGVLDGDAVAESFKLGDEAAGLAAGVLAAGEVVRAELTIGFPVARTCQVITRIAWATTIIALFFATDDR